MALSPIDWHTLLTRIKNGKCVPFIGAGVNIGYLPLGGQLAKLLLEQYEHIPGVQPCSLKDRSDLIRVTQYLAVVRKDSRLPKEDICEIIRSGKIPPTADDEPHSVLAALDLPIYLTTNYDDNMKNALEGRGKTVSVEVCRWNDRMERQTAFEDPAYRPDSSHPLVFYLHGRANDPESIVATEEDYLDFMVQMSRGLNEREGEVRRDAMFPAFVLKALKETLLFVGYSVGDFNLKVILRALKHGFGARKVFGATVQYRDDNLIASEDYLEKYFDFALSLGVEWASSREFAGSLRSKWNEFST